MMRIHQVIWYQVIVILTVLSVNTVAAGTFFFFFKIANINYVT